MTLADVLAVATGLLIIGSGFASLALMLSLLFPRAVELAAARIERRPGRTMTLGLLVLLLVLGSTGALLKLPVPGLHFLAVVVLLGGLTVAVLGGAGLSASLGRRYRRARNRSADAADPLRGALLLEGAALLPLVGWFVVVPVALLLTLGAGIQGAIARRPPAEEAVPAGA